MALMVYRKSNVSIKYWKEFNDKVFLEISHNCDTVSGELNMFNNFAPMPKSDLSTEIILFGNIIFQISHKYERNKLKRQFLLLAYINLVQYLHLSY